MVVDFWFIVTPSVGVYNCFMFCYTLVYVPSSFAIILMGKSESVALLNLSSWCLMIAVWLFLALPLVCLQFVIVIFPEHTHLPFEPPHEISNNVVCATSKASDQPAHKRSLIRAFAGRLNIF